MQMDTAVRASIEKLLEGVQIIGFDWTYLYLNEAAERHARRPSGDLIGRRMTECYPGIEQTPLFHVLKRVMQARQPEQFLSEFTYPDGAQGWFELLIEPVPDGVLVLSVDISDKQRAQAHLRQTQKMDAIGRLAGGLAHDFDHVVSAMMGFCDLVLARAADDHQLTADASELRRVGEQAERLTRHLLAFGRKQAMTPEVISLNDVVHDMDAMLTRLTGDRVRLVVDATADLRAARIDPRQIEQVLMNLVANACEAMPHGGTIRIATANVAVDEAFVLRHPGAHAGQHVTLSVEDTGCGIPADLLAHVFEPFVTTKPAGKGAGLGLATVYGTVKQSGGHVTVDSRPGVGTTITAYFPAVDLPNAAPTGTVEPRSVSGAETILVVDDDPEARDLVRRVLSPQGYTIVLAEDVWDALTLARSRAGRIDLLLTDIVLAEMDGPHLAQQVLSMRPDVRVLYVSGFAQAGSLGADAMSHRVSFLPRPFGSGALLAAVRDALDKPQLLH